MSSVTTILWLDPNISGKSKSYYEELKSLNTYKIRLAKTVEEAMGEIYEMVFEDVFIMLSICYLIPITLSPILPVPISSEAFSFRQTGSRRQMSPHRRKRPRPRQRPHGAPCLPPRKVRFRRRSRSGGRSSQSNSSIPQ